MPISYPEYGDSIWIKLNNGKEFPAKWIAEIPSAIKVHTRVLMLIPWSNIESIVVNDRKAESNLDLMRMKQEIWTFEEKIKAAKAKEAAEEKK